MKVSIATSVFVNYRLEDAIAEIANAGYEGVDLWCGRPHLYRRDYTHSDLKALEKSLNANQIRPVSLMPAFFRYPYSLSSPVDEVRSDSINYVRECIYYAEQLRVDRVLIVPTHSLQHQSTENARALYSDSLSQLCEYAQYRGITLAIEVVYPGLSDYMCCSDDAMNIIAEIHSPALGVVMDTGHINLSRETPEEFLASVREHLTQIHVNDNDSIHQQNEIIGNGCFDFPRFIDLVDKHGYSDYLTVELGWHHSFDPIPAAISSLDQLRSLLAKNGTSP